MKLLTPHSYRIIILYLLFFIVPFYSIAQNHKLSKVEKKNYKLGVKYSKKGDYTQALNYFLEVYKSSPNNVDNLYFITITYNDGLEDYTNVYKYGNILLNVLNNKIENLDPRKNKKKYEKARDLIDEIELLVQVAKPKANITKNDISDDSIVSDKVTVVTEQGADDTSTEKTEINKNETQKEGKNYTAPTDIISNDKLNTLISEFSFINLRDNKGKDDIIESVIKEYESEKNKQTLTNRDYHKVLSKNTDSYLTFEKYNTNFLLSLKKSEHDLLQAVYQYNVSLFKKDSIGQVITALKGRNELLNREISSLNWYVDQFNNNTKDSSINDKHIGNRYSVIIGRYLIEKSLTDDDPKRLLYEIKGLLKENTNFLNPQIISVVMFINSYSDNKYLYLVTKTMDDGKVDNGYYKADSNLEVYSYQSSQFNNIFSGKKSSFNDLGLKDNEIKIIQGMSQMSNKKLDSSTIYTVFHFSNEDLRHFAEQRIHLLSDQIKKNQIIIDNLIETISDTLELCQDRFYRKKGDYESKFSEYKTYINYLVLEKEVDSKSPKEQYSIMADEIIDLAKDNLGNLPTKLNRVNTYTDTTTKPMQIKFVMDTVSLKPNINQYKILSLSKIKFDNSVDTYFALDIGFEINFSFHENISYNETISYDTVQPYGSKQNESGNNEKSDYNVVGSFKVLSIDSVPILQDPNNKKWKLLEDNPSSYTSYVLYEKEEGWRLPTYKELRPIISYLALNKNKLDQLGWANNGAIYLSSDFHYDNRNNKLFRGLKLTGSILQEQNVQEGDEVYLIVVEDTISKH